MQTKWTAKSLIDFESQLRQLFEEGKINSPLHLSGGNEGYLLSIFDQVKKDDWVFSTHRSHYHYLLKGGDENKLMDEILGQPSGVCGGKGRSMHIYDKSLNFYTSALVGGTCSIAAGVALAIKHNFGGDNEEAKNKRPHVWCFLGDGGEDSGHFIEAVRFSNSRNLPITFIIEDNDLSIDSSKAMRWHNYIPVDADRIVRYGYKRKYPHVGIGKWVSF